MKTVKELMMDIMIREDHFFREMFLEDPLFLELEDVFDSFKDKPYGSIVLGISEREIESFLNRLQKALNHLYNIQLKLEDVEIEVNEFRDLYTRGSNLISCYSRFKDKIIYPSRFRKS